ncbi:MAG: serine hydrolase [Gammaproteobacteria bacterium]|nr:serine hydrolase [Gammaproteobacteria bacterium]
MLQKFALGGLCGLLIAVVITISSGHGFLITAAQRTYLDGNITANINDHRAFHTREIKTARPAELPRSGAFGETALSPEFKHRLTKYGTAAFLVLRDGAVLSEDYFNGYDARSRTNSFSMAKTVVTLLLGIAIEEGLITGLNQKIVDYLPEFSADPLGKNATIAHLTKMTSGYEWVEHYYSPISPTVELLYGPDVTEFLLSRHFSAEPGTFWEYSSASTQLLGIILQRALQAQGAAETLSDYLSTRIWQPLQMNDDALWHTDDVGMELAFCCMNSNARNFAKLGMLMLNGGRWGNRQIVPTEFITQMIQPQGTDYYGLSTWLSPDSQPAYYWFSGHLGQYVICIPEHNMVIVRLGESRDDATDFRTEELPQYVAQAMRLARLD